MRLMPSPTNWRRGILVTLVVTGLIVVSLSAGWFERRRPDTQALWSVHTLRVTSSSDGGPGSLRESIFTAGRLTERSTILCAVDRVELETPLPPLVNPGGVVLTAAEGSPCVIDARRVDLEPVLNVAAPASVLSRVEVRGAGSAAVLVRAKGAQLIDVEIVDSAYGVIATGAAAGLSIERTVLARNGIGLLVDPSSSDVRVRESRFTDHDEAGVWAVAPEPLGGTGSQPQLVVRDSRFERNRMGIVAIHTAAVIEDNEFTVSGVAAVYLTGRHVVFRSNRVRNGAAYGLLADGAEGALIENNELDRNGAVGALVRSGGGSLLRANRVYSNPYGIVIVLGQKARPDRLIDNAIFDHALDGLFVLGSSPILRDNEIHDNRAAGIRVLDFISERAGLITAQPLLENNVVRGNAFETIRGLYRLEDHAPERDESTSPPELERYR